MGIYWKHIKMHVRSALEYRSAFYLQLGGIVLQPVSALIGVVLLFGSFGALEGWTLPQILLCFAVANLAFCLAECVGWGFDRFSRLIRDGTFDRLMVQPRNILLLVLCSEFPLERLGKAAFASALLVFAALRAGIAWTAYKVLVLCLMVLGGTLVFLGLYIAFAAMCFWSVERMEIANIFTDGGREFAGYPLDIYSKFFTRFFTYVIPFGVMNYLPLKALLDRAPAWQGLLPLYSLVFVCACAEVFLIGVRHYRSAG